MRCRGGCLSRAFSAGVLLGAWALGVGNALAFTTGGAVIYNTATAVYADANNTVIAQGPFCKQAMAIAGSLGSDKPGVGAIAADRATPSALTASGRQVQSKAVAPARRDKLASPC